MANAKNTIQNIPLTGELCLNTLKTDVKAFEGYNEKNSTVFGGELAPVWKKETELGDKENSFTIFNSKGEPYFIRVTENGAPRLYDKNNNAIGWFSMPMVDKDVAPKEAFWFTILQDGQIDMKIYIDNSGKVYAMRDLRYDLYGDFEVSGEKIIYARAGYFPCSENPDNYGCISIAIIYKDLGGGYGCKVLFIYKVNYHGGWNPDTNYTYMYSGSLSTTFEDTAFIRMSKRLYDGTTSSIVNTISFIPFTGKKEASKVSSVMLGTVTYSEKDVSPTISFTDSDFYVEHSGAPIYIKKSWGGYTHRTTEVCPSGNSYLVYSKEGADNVVIVYSCSPDTTTSGRELYYQTGHDGNYFLPGIRGSFKIGNRYVELTFIDGLLYTISCNGLLLDTPGSINEKDISCSNYLLLVKKDNKWDCYYFPVFSNDFAHYAKTFTLAEKLEAARKSIVDNRYLFLSNSYPRETNTFDIETNNFTKNKIDYIDTWVPRSEVGAVGVRWEPWREITNTTGILYASGYNVNYQISGNPFISMLSNPKIMVDFPNTSVFMSDDSIEYFYSLGDNVQSAKYQGNNPEYFGTVYPIDVNGNIIYPITWDSQIINGYSNNDLIKIGDTAYPLIYWNNNQKMYAYYLLSSMENVKGAFSLQGQQYTFDNKNIYNVTFDNGVFQNVTAVCYIKNMQFLGTLPTSAVFYSKFNKTFYQFTGDAILSKMFEASDIDEIKMVGQNPSSLSLWICTDKGVYILSDTDMFKLDYDAKDIYFNEEKTIIITEGETNWIENDISLYDIGNEATETPIKLQTKFYGLGGELKANYDCWYIRLHDKDRKTGKLKLKVNTITNSSFETEEKTFTIEPNQYDSNNTIFIRYQPKYQSAVATQLELESDIAIYQLSLGVNSTDAVAQQSKFNF